MTQYTVVRGDTLSGVAARHGIRYWQNIYLDTANDAFRARRPNPDLIMPGDVITIPPRADIEPMERRPVVVVRNVPLFTQSAETCWRATAKMLFLRQYPTSTVARFDERIGDRYRRMETGLRGTDWADFYVRSLGMTESTITGFNDLHRLIATRGPVIAAIGGGDSQHSMVVAGYDILRGRWLVLDPAAGEELTFADEVIVTGSGTRPAPAASGAATLDGFRTGPATWENMARWLWMFDYEIHQRVFHY